MRLNLDVEFDWTPVTCVDGSPYAYPKPVRNVKNSFHGPAVYRWRFMDGADIAALYFGECDDLVKELNSSVNPAPGKSTGRIKAALGERMLLGQEGVIDVLKLISIKIDGEPLGAEALKDRNVRRALEALLVHQAAKDDVDLLNQETSARGLLSLL